MSNGGSLLCCATEAYRLFIPSCAWPEGCRCIPESAYGYMNDGHEYAWKLSGQAWPQMQSYHCLCATVLAEVYLAPHVWTLYHHVPVTPLPFSTVACLLDCPASFLLWYVSSMCIYLDSLYSFLTYDSVTLSCASNATPTPCSGQFEIHPMFLLLCGKLFVQLHRVPSSHTILLSCFKRVTLLLLPAVVIL